MLSLFTFLKFVFLVALWDVIFAT